MSAHNANTKALGQFLVAMMRLRGCEVKYYSPTRRFLDPDHPLTKKLILYLQGRDVGGLMIFCGHDGLPKWTVTSSGSEVEHGMWREAEVWQGRAVAKIAALTGACTEPNDDE